MDKKAEARAAKIAAKEAKQKQKLVDKAAAAKAKEQARAEKLAALKAVQAAKAEEEKANLEKYGKRAAAELIQNGTWLGRVSYIRSQTRIAANTTPARYVTASLS